MVLVRSPTVMVCSPGVSRVISISTTRQEPPLTAIPKLTLQPLVENALTHGFAGRNDRREIALTGVLEGETLVVTIRDNGNGFEREMLNQLRTAFRSIEEGGAHRPDALVGHLGLTNTYLRLYNYSRGAMRMRLYNDCGAVVELTLPRRQQQEDE